MDPAAAKQQIVERIRQAGNILVTVSTNPTVDQLAACIGLTLLLNKMEKHATAVFSGQVPSTLEFLQPDKTIETNIDSLRDFIISLDKNKADKLRYKVEDNVVKIFITPYKTSLSDKDLVFSQGEYNVEAVVALGIRERGQIDAAITAHGRILHDATVISLNVGAGKAPDVGQINWQDPAASSLSEMLVSISEAFGANLIDNQIATAFLTGIVAETSRFSNAKTSPKVMTMSAQLMAAGANQQLIVSKLDQPAIGAKMAAPKTAAKPASVSGVDGSLSITHEEPVPSAPSAEPVGADRTTLVQATPQAAPEQAPKADSEEIHIDAQGNLQTSSELIKPLAPKPAADEADQAEEGPKTPLEAMASTSEPPQKDEPDESEMPGQHTLLNPAAHQPFMESPFTANTQPEWQDPYDSVPIDPLNGSGPGKDQVFEHHKVKSLSEATAAKTAAAAPAVNSARDAVKSALVTPASPDTGQASAQLAFPPEASATTPSLPLPGGSSTLPPMADNNAQNTPPAPPPVPPPLMPSPIASVPAETAPAA